MRLCRWHALANAGNKLLWRPPPRRNYPKSPSGHVISVILYQVSVIEVIKWAMDFSLRPGTASRASKKKLLVQWQLGIRAGFGDN